MDPNATLADLRAAIRDWHEAIVMGARREEQDAAARATTAAAALDEWMSKGGFLPTAWQARRR